MKYLLPIVAGALSVLASSCNKCDSYDRPPATTLNFRVSNAQGKDVVGIGAGLYHPDSLRLRLINQPQNLPITISGTVSGEYLLGVDLTHSNSSEAGNARILLYLSKSDTDTLDVSYLIKSEKCFDTTEYTNISYNARLAQLDNANSRWLVTKR